MINWMSQNAKVEFEYSVEYIDDKKVWEDLEKYDAPWEQYKKITYDNIDDAISFFAIALFREEIYDVKLYEIIKVNGEEICERYIEFKSTFFYDMRQAVNKDMAENLYIARDYCEKAEKEIDIYKGFIKYTKQENLLDEYIYHKNAGNI